MTTSVIRRSFKEYKKEMNNSYRYLNSGFRNLVKMKNDNKLLPFWCISRGVITVMSCPRNASSRIKGDHLICIDLKMIFEYVLAIK